MTHSLPVVATAVGGNTELVDATNGAAVPAGDAAALAEALRSLVSDAAARERLGARSRQKVTEMFSWEKSMSDWETFYRSIAGSNGGGPR